MKIQLSRKTSWQKPITWLLSFQIALTPSLSLSQSSGQAPSREIQNTQITAWDNFVDQANQMVRATLYQGTPGSQQIQYQDPESFLNLAQLARQELQNTMSWPSAVRRIDFNLDDLDQESLKISSFYQIAVQVLKAKASQSADIREFKSFFHSEEFQSAFRLRIPLYALANQNLLSLIGDAKYKAADPSVPFQVKLYTYGKNHEEMAVQLEPKPISMTVAYPTRFQNMEERKAMLELIRYISGSYYLDSYFQLKLGQGIEPKNVKPPVLGFDRIYPFFEEVKAAQVRSFNTQVNAAALGPIFTYKGTNNTEDEEAAVTGLPLLLAEASTVADFADEALVRKMLSCRLSLDGPLAVLEGATHEVSCDADLYRDVLQEDVVKDLHQKLRDNLMPPPSEETSEEQVEETASAINNQIEAAHSEDFLELLLLLWGADPQFGPVDMTLRRLITEAKALAVLRGTSYTQIDQAQVLRGPMAKRLSFYNQESKESFLRKKVYQKVVWDHRLDYQAKINSLNLGSLKSQIESSYDRNYPIERYQRLLSQKLNETSQEITQALDLSQGIQPGAWGQTVAAKIWNDRNLTPWHVGQYQSWIEQSPADLPYEEQHFFAASAFQNTLSSMMEQWQMRMGEGTLDAPTPWKGLLLERNREHISFTELIQKHLDDGRANNQGAGTDNLFASTNAPQFEEIYDSETGAFTPDFQWVLLTHPDLIKDLVDRVPLTRTPEVSEAGATSKDDLLEQEQQSHEDPEVFRQDLITLVEMGQDMGFLKAFQTYEVDETKVGLTVHSLTDDEDMIELYQENLIKSQQGEYPALFMEVKNGQSCGQFKAFSFIEIGDKCPYMFELLSQKSQNSRVQLTQVMSQIQDNITEDLKEVVDSQQLSDVALRGVTSSKLASLLYITPGLSDEYIEWSRDAYGQSMLKQVYDKAFGYVTIGAFAYLGYMLANLVANFVPGAKGAQPFFQKINARYGKALHTFFTAWIGGLILQRGWQYWGYDRPLNNSVQRGYYSQIGGLNDPFYSWGEALEAENEFDKKTGEYILLTTLDTVFLALGTWAPVTRLLRRITNIRAHQKHYRDVLELDRRLKEIGVDRPQEYLKGLTSRVAPDEVRVLRRFRLTTQDFIRNNGHLTLHKRTQLIQALHRREVRVSQLMKQTKKRHNKMKAQVKEDLRFFDMIDDTNAIRTRNTLNLKLEEFEAQLAEKSARLRELTDKGVKGKQRKWARKEAKLAQARYYTAVKRARRLFNNVYTDLKLRQEIPYYEAMVSRMNRIDRLGRVRVKDDDLMSRLLEGTRGVDVDSFINKAYVKPEHEAFVKTTTEGTKVIYQRTSPYKLSPGLHALIRKWPADGTLQSNLKGWLNK